MAAGGFQGTLTIKGTTTTNGIISASNFNRAHFVRIQTTVANNVITLKDSGGSTLGSLTLHDAGDSVVIEKHPTETVETSGNAFGSAVGNPH